MTRKLLPLILVTLSFSILSPTAKSLAEPIMKPKKYHGPIPKKSFTLSVGFLAGPSNADMWDYLDRQVPQPLQKETTTTDFEPAIQIDLAFSKKVHPNFAFRLKGGVAFLESSSNGRVIGVADSVGGTPPVVSFNRTFDVMLFSIEAAGLYYFQDASVKEFQIFLGGGFSMFIPVAEFSEVLTRDDTGAEIPGRNIEDTSTAPGVNGVLGFLYHFANSWSLGAEGRVQISQSKFSIPGLTTAGIQELSFDVDYTGFVVEASIGKFF